MDLQIYLIESPLSDDLWASVWVIYEGAENIKDSIRFSNPGRHVHVHGSSQLFWTTCSEIALAVSAHPYTVEPDSAPKVDLWEGPPLLVSGATSTIRGAGTKALWRTW